MKATLIADISHIPSQISSISMKAKALIALAGMIAMTGVAVALSGDTERTRTQFFLDDGSVIRANRAPGTTWETVEAIYRPVDKLQTTQQVNTDLNPLEQERDFFPSQERAVVPVNDIQENIEKPETQED